MRKEFLEPNPCCGYVTDMTESLDHIMGEGPDTLPNAGDLIVCLNCGAVLVIIDPKTNRSRPVRRQDIEALSTKERRDLSSAQKYIRKRGWIPREAKRRSDS